MMKHDMTYVEIKNIKSDIAAFIENLKSYAEKENFDIIQNDLDFFKFISKHIVFFKNLHWNGQSCYSIEVIISDLYNYIVAILQTNNRYIFLNERSIIENYMRLILDQNPDDTHITSVSFENLKNNYNSILTSDNYSLIKSEYRTCCGYIHGSKILENDLSFYFNECIVKKTKLPDRSNYFNRIMQLIQIFDKLLIHKYPQHISSSFHRRKSTLSYLIGPSSVELIFKLA